MTHGRSRSGRILEALERQGILDTTAILLTSDNGFFFGEHRRSLECRMPYEEGIRMPLLVRYPPLVPAGSRPDDLVLSVYLAPTILEIAGVPVGDHVQGRSLVPLFRGERADCRQAILVEFYTYENPFPWLVDMDYKLVRSPRYKYIHWTHHPELDELYDLIEDPYEMRDVIGVRDYYGVRAGLQETLGELVVGALALPDQAPGLGLRDWGLGTGALQPAATASATPPASPSRRRPP